MARPKSEPRDVHRVQIDMPKKSYQRLKNLVIVTEAGGYAEVTKNALRLYEALIKEVEAGNEIFVHTKDGDYPLKIFSS
jgi:hypothetical protein